MTAGPVETLSEHRCFGGVQGFYRHQSAETGTSMRFAVFRPPQAAERPTPVVWFLSGLTCTEENFTTKAGAQRIASALGLMLVAPDTSPRGDSVPGDPEGAYDFGFGAGFYVDATVEPYARHYRMYSYVTRELPALVASSFPARMDRQGIMGHSMGGHGALMIALRNPTRFASISAFAPIVAPSEVPWGRKALAGYLGEDRRAWQTYDSCALIRSGSRVREILVDQGAADKFYAEQLRPERLEHECATAGIPLSLRIHPGYDHSYFFIASFIEDHLRWHYARLNLERAT